MQLIAKKGVNIYRDFYIDMEILPTFTPKVGRIPVGKSNESISWNKTIGDRVEKYEIIAYVNGDIPVYSPYSGYFKEIVAGGEFGRNSIHQYAVLDVVKNDVPSYPIWDINNEINKSSLIEIIKNAAIINEFSKNYLVEDLAVNDFSNLYIDVVDEQPYDLSNTATLLSYKNEVITGANILAKAFNLNSPKILIMKNFRTEGILKELSPEVEVIKVKGKYPLSHTVNDFVAKNNGLKLSAICCRAIFRAVYFGEPQISSTVTVWGDGVNNPAVCEVLNGTPISEILESRGVFGTLERAVAGGVMRGYTASLSFPPFRWDTSLFAMPLKSHNKTVECINCGRCVLVCPMGLAPYYILRNFKRIGETNAKELCADLCNFCGACSYICPSRISLNDRISDYIKSKKGENK